ncbi:EAL domain-containing protein [Aquisalimonas asiatica]|uniref:EAL domain, c-di-GMP-specific phosphodiesterase class I (Or its enzymatically inactive variant) n=1 Tax=Aquisalimonas asiatica TaxID=406100 RepID=A0A1H8S5S2_9GAMM|nr:EAL domain-containing protein [Aquisalimonas asiatica]SEO74369.1 EAL domain, c-di-GMP-specific phosphodiesterase class I (or its enzymatically inactive variant) [Aquisalimonas asiatica]
MGADERQGAASGQPGEAPVFVVFRDASTAERLAASLRDFGLRTRHMINLDMFANAAAAAPPRAVVLDHALLGSEHQPVLPATPGATWRVPLVVVGRDPAMAHRLEAVRAGADAWFTRPFNPSVLARRLHQLTGNDGADAGNLLLVDDTGALASAAATLSTAGFNVEHLDTPLTLLQRLQTRCPDMLLVSGDLQAADSGELLQAVRHDSRYYGIPALVLTAGDKRRFDGLAASAGIDGVVGLPAPTDDLQAIVTSRLERVTRLQASARYLARRDPDSGLHSAAHLLAELRQALRAGGRDRRTAALIHIQAEPADARAARDPRMDRALTAAVSRRLQALLPSASVAARLDRHNYAALVFGHTAAELEQLTGQLLRTLEKQAPATAVAMGTAALGGTEDNAEAVLERARQAGAPGEPWGAGPAPADTDGDATGQWDQTLRHALDQGRLRLVYQPIASLAGNPTTLYEAFIRLLDEDGGDILPQEFLPAAHRLGMTGALDRWIVDRTLAVLASQQALGNHPTLFVKLFADTVADPRFPDWLQDRLGQHGVDGTQLVLQVPQNVAATRFTETTAMAQAVGALGCMLALEHYGARPDHNNLLQRLPLHYIKLSPALTGGIDADEAQRSRVQAVTSQARAADARTIAALVQDVSSLSFLWASGVDYIQGYFMQEPSDIFATDDSREAP